MGQRVLIVPDKFKGTLTAAQAAAAMARGWLSGRPRDLVEQLPMSDGGDGFGSVLGALLGAETRPISTVDAAHRPLASEWRWAASSQTAIVESAGSIGLALVPQGQYHPFELDTRGLGETLLTARRAGAQRIIIGLGGSATNDAGFGMVRALGGRFFDLAERELQRWTELTHLERWQLPAEDWSGCEIVAACDVTNPLLGPQGCSRVFGPQKGLEPKYFLAAEAALARLAEVTKRQRGRALDTEAGSGAAGGLGFAIRAFLNGRLESGFEIYSGLADLPQRIAAADLVITGEGGLDRQTLMGKGTGRVAQLCRSLNKPCLGLAGRVEATPDLTAEQRLFTATFSIVPQLATLNQALSGAAGWVENLAREAARRWNSGPA